MTAVHCTQDGHCATVMLDNPSKLNVLTPEMLNQLEAHLSILDTKPGLRCLILTAAPSKAFCAGADIKAWGDLPAQDFMRCWIRSGHRVFDRLARLSVPTIAAINGHAFGGGLELVAACDIRIMAPDATIALPESKVGIVPGWSGTHRLARLLPEALLKEMALFGRHLSAERARATGFIAEISENPLTTAQSIAESVTTSSPMSIETAKYMIHASVDEDRGAMIEALGGGMMADSADKTEGVSAFRAKRNPNFLVR